MYTLMIVEDEPLIREGLKHYFPWSELGVTRIIEAEDGAQGERLALLERPDLVITDIRMPEMDGLTMIERLRPRLSSAAFVILTGYNDFEYAQRAIKLGNIQAYLLKPLEYEESLATVQDCLAKLRQRQAEDLLLQGAEQLKQERRREQERQIVKRLLDEPGFDPAPALQALGMPDPVEGRGRRYAAFAATAPPPPGAQPPSPDVWAADAERFIAAMASRLFGTQVVGKLLAYVRGGKLFVLALAESEAETDGPRSSDAARSDLPAGTSRATAETAETAETAAALAALNRGRGAAIYIAAGGLVDTAAEARQSFAQAEQALHKRYYQPGAYLFRAASQPTPSSSETQAPLLPARDRELLQAHLMQGDADAVRELLLKLGEGARQLPADTPPARWLALLQELVSVTLRYAHRHGIAVEEFASGSMLTLAFADDFAQAEDLFAWLADWTDRLIAANPERGGSQAGGADARIFTQIEQFVRQHLDQEVTLQMVADRFFYNPSYLSRLFKTKLNKNYLAFVAEIRIRYAQDRLKDPSLFITDVCAMCGYKSYKHFVKTFRSVAGMTPTDYRKQLGIEP
ncbi:response regulator [Paenibacillus methanolicus]|uniref:Two-component system response regulator YesN n=1 Tax=Paenibacillus methanolicus TaxID=582686 RepID=A0A5S5C8U6_9BACL|nr:response regulator [Paenibacillus methanolicus]TYP74806.1 two-component system response regulator YesN [Paenibacillus methanolicus]